LSQKRKRLVITLNLKVSDKMFAAA